MDTRVPGVVDEALRIWLEHHDRLAPSAIEGLYIVGSAALGDWQTASDIDIVAFTADPTDAAVVAQLETAHDRYRAEAGVPTVDGPVLAWADVTSPPIANQRPWTLDGAFRFDGDCFEINPVVWYTLATYGIAVRGEPASVLDVRADRGEREGWCRENLRTYWRGVRDEIADVLKADPERSEFPASTTEWCTLGVARISYTIETGDVTSKTAAGRWASDRYPAHTGLLSRAIDIRAGVAAEAVDRVIVAAVVDWMSEHVD